MWIGTALRRTGEYVNVASDFFSGNKKGVDLPAVTGLFALKVISAWTAYSLFNKGSFMTCSVATGVSALLLMRFGAKQCIQSTTQLFHRVYQKPQTRPQNYRRNPALEG